MNRIIGFFKNRTSAILLFHVGVLFFNWPLLSITADDGGVTAFYYIFVVWTVIVALLMVTGYALHRATTTDKKD
ncbi:MULTISPECIES: hypothetical protein [unclassified Pseudodesulfovibrio]|uniref:hypothetical protein n=1 Tax=unclassified Pseudodesulfovibrio TaxID=2661612 RepID=UPI0013E36CED|nr:MULTISPECIES: hypothetical protein [unclassified Pseudodesulfovibrio]MCJ2165517.1 hypothetical protein [Pseudodesulfovibrio sp. S3-i]